MAYTKKAIQESKDSLTQNYLKQGDTVYLSLSRVSRSGMSRVIKCMVITNEAKETGKIETRETGKPIIYHADVVKTYNISFDVAHAVDMPFVDGLQGGVRIGGCGMDMGFHLVDCLSYALFGLPVNQNSDKDTEEDSKLGFRYRWI